MTLSRRLAVGFLLVLSAFALAAMGFRSALSNLETASAQNAAAYQVYIDMESAISSTLDRVSSARGYVISFLDRHQRLYAEGAAKFTKAIADSHTHAKGHPDEVLLNELIDALDKAGSTWGSNVGDKVMQLAKSKDTAAEAAELLMSPKSTIQTFRDVVSSLEGRMAPVLEANHAQQAKAVSQAHLLLIGSALLALVTATGAAFWLTSTISTPVKVMTGTMNGLAQGHLDTAIPFVERRDELGAMALAVQTFRDQGRDKLRLEQAARLAEADQAAAREREHALTQQRQAEALHTVQTLGEALKHLAKGDLAYRIETPLAGEADLIREDYNASVESLRVAMASVARAVETIQSGSQEVSAASDSFAQRLEQQAASVEETASALDEITATVKETAKASTIANTTVTQATSEAKEGNQKVDSTVRAIHDISASSEKISTIIGVIDEIAFQTNLLALNAGVEAARAGDSGRGFAVVAQEVRALAQRSADAAKEIKQLIADAQASVMSGVARAGEANGTIARLLGQITEIQALTHNIAQGTKEQAIGAEEVNTAVNSMDQMAQQNAAMVQQTAAVSRAMAQEAQTLASLVNAFNLGQDLHIAERTSSWHSAAA